MATINIDVPAANSSRVIHALCSAAGLEESPANAKEAVLAWIKATVANVERAEAEQDLPTIDEPDVETIVS